MKLLITKNKNIDLNYRKKYVRFAWLPTKAQCYNTKDEFYVWLEFYVQWDEIRNVVDETPYGLEFVDKYVPVAKYIVR